MATPQRDFSALPVIGIEGLYSDDRAERRAVAQGLDAAAVNAGFFYITGHRVVPALRAGLLDSARAFFALPMADKMQSYIGHSRGHRGYVPEGEEIFGDAPKADKKEAFDTGFHLPLTDPAVVAGKPMLGPNVWPLLPGFARQVSAYYHAVFDLGVVLFRGFALALGLAETYFDPLVKKPPAQLRLIHYPFDPRAQDATGIGVHTDYECFTLLWPTAPGLEVMNGRGQWIDAPPLPDAFIVNIGDLLEVWTGGRYRATPHRVRKVQQERYSFPLFFMCDYDTVVAPLDGSDSHAPVVAGEHLAAQTARTFRYLRQRVAAN